MQETYEVCMNREALSHILIADAHGQTLYKLREGKIIVLVSIYIDHILTWDPPLSAMVNLGDDCFKYLPDLFLDLLHIILLGLCNFISSDRFLSSILLFSWHLSVWFFICLFL